MGSNQEHKGTCLCGAVELTVRVPPSFQFYCHCNDCKRYHSNSVIPSMIFPCADEDDPAVEVTSGEENLAQFNLTEPVSRYFCKTCGSPVINRLTDIKMVESFPVLLATIPFEPTFHMHYESKLMSIKDGLPKYKDLPADIGGTGDILTE